MDRFPIRTLAPDDPDYPRLLLQLHKPPNPLFVRGNTDILSAPCLAVVGSRRMTSYGRDVVTLLIPELVAAGVTIVSGLALGIDAAAHAATLEAQGKTAAVLGSGVDNRSITPRSNARLAESILEHGGCLVSEQTAGAPGLPYHFPVRNRILSGLCHGTLVVEAAPKSGTLITAQAALEQNREVFAIPGDIRSPLCAGTNGLIRAGAHAVTCTQDILHVLGVEVDRPNSPQSVIPDSAAEAALLPHLGRVPTHIDELARAAKLPLPTVSQTLMLMEIKGRVRHVGGQQYRL